MTDADSSASWTLKIRSTNRSLTSSRTAARRNPLDVVHFSADQAGVERALTIMRRNRAGLEADGVFLHQPVITCQSEIPVVEILRSGVPTRVRKRYVLASNRWPLFPESRHPSAQLKCPLCAKSGHLPFIRSPRRLARAASMAP